MNCWGIAATLALSAMVGCSDSDPAFDSEAVVALQECADDAYLDFVSVAFYLNDVVGAVRGFTPPEPQVAGVPFDLDITVTPTGTANEFDFDFPLDVDGDTVPDTNVSGRILFSADPVGNEVVGETATATLTRTGTGSVSAIDADLRLSFVSNQETDISGSATSTIDGCTISFEAEAGAPVRLTIASSFLDARLAGDPLDTSAFQTLGFGLDGSLLVQLTDGVTTVETTGTVSSGQFGVVFSDSAVNGVTVPEPESVTLPVEADLAPLVQCQSASIFMVTALLNLLEDDPGEGETLTFTPVEDGLPFEYDFAYDANGGMISGRAVFPGDPNGEAPLVGNILFSTWTVVTETEPQLAGLSFPVDTTATSANGFMITVDAEGPRSMLGQFTATDGVCTATLEFETAFVLDDEGGGTFTIDIAIGANTMNLVISAGESTGWQISVNGVALPQVIARFLIAIA